jgi:uncharacterized UPF0160 family protein
MLYVHAGQFHADDAFCIAAAQLLGFGPEFERVRELPENFNPQSDIALDIGGVFNPAQNKFDHHQRGGSDDGLAAIGKFWSVYGPRYCQDQRVANRVYLTLIGSIDRADIGVSDWTPIRDDWRHLTASGFIASMNPQPGRPVEETNWAFAAAVSAAKVALVGAIAQARLYIEMSDVVEQSTSHFNGRVLEIAKSGPWQEHVFEQSLDMVLFVIYPSERGGFCIQCVPDKPGSFGQRKPLPESWKGLRGEELAAVIRREEISLTVGPALFCHPGRFIGGAETLADTLLMAKLAIG